MSHTSGLTASIEVLAVRGREARHRGDFLATEEPLEIRLEGPDHRISQVSVTMRTPGHDLELAVGFLYTEALIAGRDDLADPPVRQLLVGGPSNILTIRLRRSVDAEPPRRNFYATASCGLCGKASIEQVQIVAPRLTPGPAVAREVIISLPDALRRAQAVFAQTGGLHATGLFDTQGRLLLLREDVGRHNAFDKVVGRALLDGLLPLRHHVMLVSGRLSFELVQKAARAAVPVLCAVSAPSSLAVDTAAQLGITLVGFLRGDHFNVYTHPERVLT